MAWEAESCSATKVDIRLRDGWVGGESCCGDGKGGGAVDVHMSQILCSYSGE